MGAFIEVSYCVNATRGKAYASGSTRIYEAELAQWVLDNSGYGPVLITDIQVIRGAIGQLATAK